MFSAKIIVSVCRADCTVELVTDRAAKTPMDMPSLKRAHKACYQYPVV